MREQAFPAGRKSQRSRPNNCWPSMKRPSPHIGRWMQPSRRGTHAVLLLKLLNLAESLINLLRQLHAFATVRISRTSHSLCVPGLIEPCFPTS